MEQEGNFIQKSRQYLVDSVDELRKVSAPTRQEAIQATVVTTFIVVLVAVVIALMDLVFGQIMSAVLS